MNAAHRGARRLLCLLLALSFVAALAPVPAHADVADDVCVSALSADGRHNYVLLGWDDPPDCTTPGKEYWQCSYCGKRITDPIPAPGHNWTRETIAKQPSCTETGMRTFICANCGMFLEDTIPALGHDYANEITKEAICEEDGAYKQTCSRCGDVQTGVIEALGHDWDIVVTEAQGLKDGLIARTCRRCGKHESERISSAAIILAFARQTPPEAENADPLLITKDPEGGCLDYDDGTLNMSVEAKGGVSPYRYTWHRVTALDTASVFSSAVVCRFTGAQEAYSKESSSFSSAFQRAAVRLGLAPGKMPGQGESEQARRFVSFTDQVVGGSEPVYTADAPGHYYCVVTDRAGSRAVSLEAAVDWTLYLTEQPRNTNLYGQDSVSLSCSAAGGEPDYFYAWYKADGSVCASGSRELTVTETGEYFCIVSDQAQHSVQSGTVSVYESEPLWVSSEQSEYGVIPGEVSAEAVLSFGGGIAPYSCQWRADGEPLASFQADEASDARYVLDDIGVVCLTVTDAMGETASCEISGVYKQLEIARQPEGGILPKGGGTHILSIAMAQGKVPFTYTLYRDGAVCSTATGQYAYTVDVSSPGEYFFHIKDAAGHWADSRHVNVYDYVFQLDRGEVDGIFTEQGEPSDDGVSQSRLEVVYLYPGPAQQS